MIIYKILILLLLLGCLNNNKNIKVEYYNLDMMQNKEISSSYKTNILILEGILIRKDKEYKKSELIFKKLYKKTGAIEYKFWELSSYLEYTFF